MRSSISRKGQMWRVVLKLGAFLFEKIVIVDIVRR